LALEEVMNHAFGRARNDMHLHAQAWRVALGDFRVRPVHPRIEIRQRLLANHPMPLLLIAHPSARTFIELRQKIKGDICRLEVLCLCVAYVVN
jgi:hypothetical protein